MAISNNEMRFVGINQPNQNHANNNGSFSLQPYSSSSSGSGSGIGSSFGSGSGSGSGGSGSNSGSGTGYRSLQADQMIFYDPQSTWMMQPYSTVQALAQNGGGQSVHFINDLQDQVPSFGDVAPYSAISGMRPQGFGYQSGQYEFDRGYPHVENNNLSLPSWPLQPAYNQQHQLNQATITGAVNPKMLNSMMSQTSIPSGGMPQYPSGAILSSSISVHHQAQLRDVHRQEGFLSMLNPNYQVPYYQGNGDSNLSSPYTSVPQNGVHIPSQIYEPKNTRIGTLFDPSLKLFEESEFFDKYNQP